MDRINTQYYKNFLARSTLTKKEKKLLREVAGTYKQIEGKWKRQGRKPEVEITLG